MAEITQKITGEYHKYIRVWRLLRKPTMREFMTISKVTAVGLIVIGALGFLVQLIVTSIPGA